MLRLVNVLVSLVVVVVDLICILVVVVGVAISTTMPREVSSELQPTATILYQILSLSAANSVVARQTVLLSSRCNKVEPN